MLMRTTKPSICDNLCILERNRVIITAKCLTSMHKLKLFANTNSFQQTNTTSQDKKVTFECLLLAVWNCRVQDTGAQIS